MHNFSWDEFGTRVGAHGGLELSEQEWITDVGRKYMCTLCGGSGGEGDIGINQSYTIHYKSH